MILNKSSVDRGLCRGHIYKVLPFSSIPFPHVHTSKKEKKQFGPHTPHHVWDTNTTSFYSVYFVVWLIVSCNFILQTESIDLADRLEKSNPLQIFARRADGSTNSLIDSDGLPYIGQVCYIVRDVLFVCHLLFPKEILVFFLCRW